MFFNNADFRNNGHTSLIQSVYCKWTLQGDKLMGAHCVNSVLLSL